MKRALITIVLSLVLAGCVSKPAGRVETVASVAADAPLAVGDCLVLEPEHDGLEKASWRRTIDADGYFPAPLGQRVKVVGKSLAEARELIVSHYTERLIHRRKLQLVLMGCEEYDRKKVEMEQQ